METLGLISLAVLVRFRSGIIDIPTGKMCCQMRI